MASRAALRFGRGPRAVRRDHRAAARGGQPDQHRAGRGRRARSTAFDEEPRADAPRDGDALGAGRADRRLPRSICKRPPASCGTTCWPHGRRHGFRNAQATVLAPTGTISFMMDCDTTGIEPDIALVKYKQLAGGGMLKIVNQTVPLALETLGYERGGDRVDRGLHRQGGHDRGRGRPEGRAPAGVRLRLPAAQRHAVDPLEGPHPDDGRRPAVPLGGDLEDGQHAQGQHARGRGRRLHRRLAAGAEGAGHLPRRLEGGPAAVDQDRRRTRRPKSCWPPRAASGCPTPGSRSPTSSASPATRATSPWACIPTAGPASCSSPWPRKAARSAA